MAKKKAAVPADGIKVRGFFRLQLVSHDPAGNPIVDGDSGWVKNQVTNLGFSQYLVDQLGGTAKAVSRMMLGTGAAPASNATALPGELNTATYTRTTITTANVGSFTLRNTATFSSASSHITASVALSNIGIINSVTSGGTLLAGNVYTSSAWNTNQDVNCTYDISFS